jgi:hypothetical protein
MKKKINITVQVTYEVTKECEVDSDVLASLEHIQEYYPNRVDAYIADMDKDARDGYDWIVDNCDENKCVDWEVQIQDLTEEE